MKILNKNKRFIALISALFLVGCSHFKDQIGDLDEELVVEQEVEEEVQETEKSADQIWEELAEKAPKK